MSLTGHHPTRKDVENFTKAYSDLVSQARAAGNKIKCNHHRIQEQRLCTSSVVSNQSHLQLKPFPLLGTYDGTVIQSAKECLKTRRESKGSARI